MSTLSGFDDGSEDFRRFLDALKPSIESFALYRKEIQKIAEMMPVSEITRVFDRYERELAELSRSFDFISLRESLAAAIEPLPDLSMIIGPPEDSIWLAESVSRLNDEIAAAHMVGAVTLTESPAGEQQETHTTEEQAESQLIEVVPADTLDSLREVHFAPILSLERALRDPELMLSLKSREFEEFIAELVRGLGFEDVLLTPPSGEGKQYIADDGYLYVKQSGIRGRGEVRLLHSDNSSAVWDGPVGLL